MSNCRPIFLGKYIFTESSAPRNVFDFAWIQSPQVDAVGAVHCFRFWYHMFGTSIGTLRVYQAFNDNLPGRLVWSLSGPQGAKWLHGQVPLESNQPYTVRTSFYNYGSRCKMCMYVHVKVIHELNVKY